MTTPELLLVLQKAGVDLWVDDEKLRFTAPPRVMTRELRSELSERKAEIVSLLRDSGPVAHPPDRVISALPRDRPFPLSSAQQRLWFLNQLDPESTVYNIPLAFHLAGPLNPSALEASLNELIRRHEILRTSFPLVEGKPVQMISEFQPFSLTVVDLSSWAGAEKESRIRHLLREEAERPFDLSCGPLLRIALFRFGSIEHVLRLNMHHIISDGWSIGIFCQEIGKLYEACSAGRPSSLPELRIQYRDFAMWQQTWLGDEILEKQLSYWKTKLAGTRGVLKLPVDHPRPKKQKFLGGSEDFFIAKELAAGVKLLSQHERSTPFMTILAIFQTLLHRYSGQTDILVGVPVAGRTHLETEKLIGCFVNTVVLRTDFSDDPTFRELLARVREVSIQAYEHQDLPFEKLIEEIKPERGLSPSPLFRVMFSFERTFIPEMEVAGLKWSPVKVETLTSKFDLSLSFVEEQGELKGSFEYSYDLFARPTIQRMVRHFQTLGGAIVRDPDQRVSRLPLLCEAERHQVLIRSRGAKNPRPKDQCIHDLFEKRAVEGPHEIAAIWRDQRLTYSELNRRANQVAHCLQTLNVGPDVLVGVCLQPSLDMMVALLGILKAGGAYVPLDPGYPQERLQFMLKDAEIPVLLTQDHLVEKFSDFAVQIVCLDSGWQSIGRHSQENVFSTVQAENLCYMTYTSGSTGTPKGVLITHRSLVNHSLSIVEHYGLRPRDRVLQFASLSFDVAAEELFPSLAAGATVILRGGDELATIAGFERYLEQNHITIVNLPAAYWQEWVSTLALSANYLPPDLRLVIAGSESVSASSFQAWRRVVRDQVRWCNAYGPTEATITSTIYDPSNDCPEDNLTVPIGKPMTNVETFVLDASLNLMPIGVRGELYIGGEALARGYWRLPELTAEKFVPDPFSTLPGARLYRTGDSARFLSDGDLEFLGRTDHQVKIRGFRIELGEVESALYRYSGIREAVVIAHEQESGDRRLVAYFTLNHQNNLTVGGLRAFLRQKLPEYMVPANYVELAEFPRTRSGKIDRQELAKSCPALDHTIAKGHLAPSNSIEEVIATIWSTLLGREKVGVHDSFFDLGGHSLLATQVISRLREAFGVELPIRKLFEDPTVSGLAAAVKTARLAGEGSTIPPIVRGSGEQVLQVSFAQQRVWFLAQMEPGSSVYNVPTAIRLKGPLNLQAMADSLSEVARRHDVLRTTFPTVEGKASRRVVPFHSHELPITDLQDLGKIERESQALHLAREEARSPFDLSAGPLWRVRLLKLGELEHLLLLTMHHMVSDEWSIRVFFRELRLFYEAFSSQRPSSVSGLAVQYADFIQWQRQWLQGEVLAKQISYWTEQLKDVPKVLELPKDHLRPPVQTFRGATTRFMISPEITSRIKELARQENATLFMVLLAAFQTWLHRYTQQLDIPVGSPIAGRTRQETEELIGLFVNTLVLRVNFLNNPTFREVVRQVRQVALGAYAHQDLPFEKLVEILHPDRTLSHSPLFQVMFLLQDDLLEDSKLGEMVLSEVEVASETAKFDLTLAMEERDEGVVGWLNYNTDLFETATAERMATHFQTLLARLAIKPQLRVRDCSLLTRREEEQILLQWNQTARPYPENVCVHKQIEHQARQNPNATAISFQGQRLTYSELNNRANRLAHLLLGLGVRPEILVGICMERSFEMVIGLLAILKAGGAYVPLDPSYPPARLASIFGEAALLVLLTQEKLLSKLPSHTSTVLCLDGSDLPLVTEHGLADINPSTAVTADNLAYVLYTSGSTGRPKGVMIVHRGLTNYLTWSTRAYGVADGQGAPVHTSISFDLTITAIFPPLLAGRQVHLLPEEAGVGGLSADLLTERNYSLIKITPAHLELLSRLVPREAAARCARSLIIGGENLSAESIAFWQQAAPETVLVNEYGPTETVVGCCVYQVPQGRHQTGSIPIGRPIANTQLYILDRRQQPVAIGVHGELHIGGAGLARGYLKSPELTAEKFIPNPFSNRPGERLYRTGDLCVYLADGNIEYVGRIDHQVKIRGFRIELGEIEEVLAQCPRVQECVVVLRQDLPGEARLAAYIVPTQNSLLTSGEVREFLKQSLPEYMLPSVLLLLNSLPVTPNGKVDRQALPAPTEMQTEPDRPDQSPRTLVEKELWTIWCDLLNNKQVGVHENFFDLGGHSLLAIQLLFEVKKCFQVTLPVRALFEAPTIALLSERITGESQAANRHYQHGTTPLPFLTPIQPLGGKRPLYVVPGGIGGEVEFLVYARLARHLGLNQPVYGLKARGSDGKQGPHTQAGQMAADYIKEIRSFQPESPYMLAGECVGGIVAFEMARQLRAQGQEVSLLVLLDTACPRRSDYIEYQFEKVIVRWRKSILARGIYHLQQLRRISSPERSRYVRQNYQKAKLRFHSPVPQSSSGISGEQLAVPQTNDLLDHYVKTLIRHKPKVYPGRITLLVSEESYRNDPSMGWSKFAGGGLDIHPLPGDHQTYIREYVLAAAKKLKECLEKL